MSFWDFKRDPSSVLTLLQFGAEQCIDEQTLLHGSRLTRAQLDDANAELSAVQELCVINNLQRAMNRIPGLGLEIGLRCHFSTFGMWGYGLIASATLGEAIDKAIRFIRLTFAYSMIEKVMRGDQTVLVFSPPQDMTPSLTRFIVEREMGAATALMQDVTGGVIQLSAFSLQSGRGRIYGISDKHRKVGGAEVSAAKQGYFLSFPAKFLTFKPSTANATTAAMCEQVCQRLLDRRSADTPLSELVKEYLSVSSLPILPTLGSISRLTSTSERTIKRHLQREGQSFRALVADGRAELAAELVLSGKHSMKEIAEKLGYSSPSCFSQAFKRWHSVSPMAFKRKRLDIQF